MRVGVSLGLVAALQLIGSLVAQLAVLRIVGIGSATDAYVAAQAVPLVLAAIVGASLQSLWLPRFARVSHDTAVLQAEQAIAQGQTLLLLGAASLALGLLSPAWVGLAFPGFTLAQRDMVVTLGAPLLAASVLGAQSLVLTAGLRARGRFLAPEIASLAGTVALVAATFAAVPHYGIVAAPWLAFARAFAVWIAHWMLAGRPGAVLRSTSERREVSVLMRPLAGSAVLIKTGPLVDRYFSSQTGAGGVTTFNLAQLAINALGTIFERALLAPTLPEYGRLAQKNDISGVRAVYHRTLWRTAALVGVVGAGLVLLGPVWNPLLAALLRVGADAANSIWLVCLLLLPALYVAVAGASAVAVFYAFGDTRTPAAIGLAGFAVGLVLKGVLTHHFGILGISAGASIYLALNMATYHVALRRHLERPNQSP